MLYNFVEHCSGHYCNPSCFCWWAVKKCVSVCYWLKFKQTKSSANRRQFYIWTFTEIQAQNFSVRAENTSQLKCTICIEKKYHEYHMYKCTFLAWCRVPPVHTKHRWALSPDDSVQQLGQLLHLPDQISLQPIETRTRQQWHDSFDNSEYRLYQSWQWSWESFSALIYHD